MGEENSINIEIVLKSHKFLKNKVIYILLGNIKELTKYLNKLDSKLKINEIYNPLSFENYNHECLNLFNIDNVSKKKYENLINQINISNYLANSSQIDLVTLPIKKNFYANVWRKIFSNTFNYTYKFK